ncbi:hypothetical protein ABEB36_000109 [Hypothenemus hampei]|uniref:MADF domain-containing protein n=1 Tax=Hypothenemus hampei TaxID=57062 RepID=A0ABD1FAA2_HYPHA
MDELIDEFIINSVRELSFIYDKKKLDYKNISKKVEGFRVISMNIKSKLAVNIEVESVIKRWESLKVKFVREHKKMREKLPSGSGAVTQCTWPFYNYLLFLESHVLHICTKSTYKCIPKQSSHNQLQIINDN